MNILGRSAGVLVAPASRRRFCAATLVQKSPAGRRRHENLRAWRRALVSCNMALPETKIG